MLLPFRTPGESSEGNRLGDRMPDGFLRRGEMSVKARTWIVLSLAGAALVCGPAAVAQQQEPD
jgi:hypothetical protein